MVAPRHPAGHCSDAERYVLHVTLADSDFLRACRGLTPAATPIWFMRQAGRALPEYRAIRGTESILEAIANPELAAEITMQPVRRYGVDAAILFSDIVVPLAAIGVGVEIVAGKGPVIAEPFRTAADLTRIRPLEASVDTGYVIRTIEILREELDVPLIGFAGAPFTVGSYFIEGGATRTFAKTKSLMHNDPALFMQLMDRLADLAIDSLQSQIDAGVNAVQLFDSWAGALSRADYQRFVLPSSTKVLEALAGSGVPRIHFGVDAGEIIDLMAGAGAEVVGVDWRMPLTTAALRIGDQTTLQGNLDPAICLAGYDAVIPEARRILAEGAVARAHIFNLGHGVLPETDPDVLTRLVEFVHESTRL
jgi:uroporphyrinogen decarboxylase